MLRAASLAVLQLTIAVRLPTNAVPPAGVLPIGLLDIRQAAQMLPVSAAGGTVQFIAAPAPVGLSPVTAPESPMTQALPPQPAPAPIYASAFPPAGLVYASAAPAPTGPTLEATYVNTAPAAAGTATEDPAYASTAPVPAATIPEAQFVPAAPQATSPPNPPLSPAQELQGSQGNLPPTPSTMAEGSGSASSIVAPEDLAHTVSERVAEDKARMNMMLSSLKGIQHNIAQAKVQVLGKAYELETLRKFFDDHQAAKKEHEQLKLEIARLTGEATSLSLRLGEVYSRTANSSSAFRSEVARIRNLSLTVEAKIPVLKKELGREGSEKGAIGRMKAENAKLEKRSAAAIEGARKAMAELYAARSLLRQEVNTSKKVGTNIVHDHDKGLSCEHEVEQLEEQLRQKAAQNEELRKSAAAGALQAEKDKQAARSNNAILKARLQKAKANVVTIQTQILATKGEAAELQKEGETEMGRLRNVLEKMKERSVVDESELMSKVKNRREVEREMHRLEGDVQKLEGEKLRGTLAKLRAKGSELRIDLKQAQVALQSSQESLADYKAEAAKAEDTVQSLQDAAERDMHAAQQIAREALVRVAQAENVAEEAASKAEDGAIVAESAALSSCDSLWDKLHGNVITELQQCSQVEADLQTVSAQVAALSSAVSARSHVTFPADGGGDVEVQ